MGQKLGNIRIVKGDIFTTEMQTLTVPVNTVGIMGKGLALSFKLRYPQAYFAYSMLCRTGRLRPGKPVIYTSEEGKFLFFPTKRHWREKSRLSMIEKGLDWFVKHYKEYGVKSVAFPALGCGVGGLEWEEVRPLMVCKLSAVDIPVEIYLPFQRKPREEYFTREFYFRGTSNV